MASIGLKDPYENTYHYGDDVDFEEVPQSMRERIVEASVRKLECPNCEKEMFYEIVPGHNGNSSCRHCEESFTVVG